MKEHTFMSTALLIYEAMFRHTYVGRLVSYFF